MTLDEAKKVAQVIAGVDGGCPYCIHDAVDELEELLPEFDWAALVALNDPVDQYFGRD